MASKRNPKTDQKKRLLSGRPPERILMNLLVILGATWGGRGDPTSDFFGDFLALGVKMRPRRLQELHKTPQELPRVQFRRIFNGFGVDF